VWPRPIVARHARAPFIPQREFSGWVTGTPVHQEVCFIAPSQDSEMCTWFLWLAVYDPLLAIFRQPSSG